MHRVDRIVSYVIPHWNCATNRLAHVASGLAFTTDSRHTEAGRLYKCPAEDETRTLLQRALDNAGHEYNFRKNELDYATAFASPVKVPSRSHCAYDMVQVSSTGRPWFVDNDSLGGDDDARAAERGARVGAEWPDVGEAAHPVQRPHQEGHQALGAAPRHLRDRAAVRGRVRPTRLRATAPVAAADAAPRAPHPVPRTPCRCRCRCRCRRR